MRLNTVGKTPPSSISWMFNTACEGEVENEILLTTPDFSFDVTIQRYEDDLLRYSVRKHNAPESLATTRRFAFAEDAAEYLYRRGCSCAHEMIRLGIEALG